MINKMETTKRSKLYLYLREISRLSMIENKRIRDGTEDILREEGIKTV